MADDTVEARARAWLEEHGVYAGAGFPRAITAGEMAAFARAERALALEEAADELTRRSDAAVECGIPSWLLRRAAAEREGRS